MLDDKRTSFSFVAENSPESSRFIYQENEGNLPFLPLRDNVLFPGTVSPITIGRKLSIKTVKRVEKNDELMVIGTQIDSSTEVPVTAEIYKYGVVVKLVHLMKLPDGTWNALVQAFNRVMLKEVYVTDQGWMAEVVAVPDLKPQSFQKAEYTTMINMLKERTTNLLKILSGYPQELINYIESMTGTSIMVNNICSYLPISVEEKHNLLRSTTDLTRAERALQKVNELQSMADLKRNIERKTQNDLDKQQREYFLNQEIKNIQAELGAADESSVRQDDYQQLSDKAQSLQWSDEQAQFFNKELKKLQRINIQSPDYNVQLTYLQTIVDLPWNNCTKDCMNLKQAEKILNADHYGMEKVKERILEHLAVLKLRKDQRSPIICLYGPPGVGKTSLGKSIASALKRQYVRISLGGVHDESEIRGHRRTYIGAMPGRIIKGMLKAKSANPVFILDEIDKISTQNIHGDPSSAMLEVLDPEQNNAFHDNYLDMDYDLSKVMFIATANDINNIPRPLLDRMELIEVSGYITEEKIEIAKRHLVPKKKDENGLNEFKKLQINKSALEFIIERYTRESGVRSLEKQIDKLFRKVALKVAQEDIQETSSIDKSEVEELLGKPIFSRDKYQGNDYAGVVTGLAWTSVGGEILFIETSLSQGKAGKLTLTGNLGDVMKESAMLAVEYIKAHAEMLNLDMRVFDNYNIHIHVPEGAVPKDGPSAGITMATSIASALTQRKIRKNIAMTGEITLRGKVLPVGGIKEKILAAKRAGITEIILCQENRKDIEDIPEMYLKGLSFHYVEKINEVWDIALLDEKVKDAMEFKFIEETKKD